MTNEHGEAFRAAAGSFDRGSTWKKTPFHYYIYISSFAGNLNPHTKKRFNLPHQKKRKKKKNEVQAKCIFLRKKKHTVKNCGDDFFKKQLEATKPVSW